MLREAWKFFCSVKLTIVLFVLILIPSIIGTIILQNAPNPSQYLEIYGPTWDGIFRFLGFYDVYHDWRFVILLALLGLNTLACTINRLKLRWNRLGTMMTHFGLLFVLIGALAGAIFGVKGFMVISEGESTDVISVGSATDDTETLPFQVKLVDFILDVDKNSTNKLAVLNVRTNEQASYKIEEGKSYPLPQSRWKIKSKPAGMIDVKQIIPNAAVVTSIKEGPEKTGIAAMEFVITGNETDEHDFALSQLQHPFVLKKANLGVGYLKINEKDLAGEEINRASALYKTANQLEVILPEGDKKIHSAQAGSKFKVEGTDYSVEVLRYVPDFVIGTGREVTTRSESPNNPAVQVRVSSPDSGSQEQWLFAKFPTAHTSTNAPFQLRFRRNPLLGDIASYLLVLNPSDGGPIAAQFHEGMLVGKKDVELGKPLDVEDTPYKVRVDRFLENANIVRKVADRPDLPNQPAAEVSVEGSPKPYYLWEGTPVDVPGYKMMFMQEDTIKDFFSVLQIINSGEVVAEKKIEVNDPLRYGGYTLYQASYDEKGLSWSGLQVKKDPGVFFVYVGFTVLILGMIIIFYVNPLLRKVRKGAKTA